jgi:hypothetical protein
VVESDLLTSRSARARDNYIVMTTPLSPPNHVFWGLALHHTRESPSAGGVNSHQDYGKSRISHRFFLTRTGSVGMCRLNQHYSRRFVGPPSPIVGGEGREPFLVKRTSLFATGLARKAERARRGRDRGFHNQNPEFRTSTHACLDHESRTRAVDRRWQQKRSWIMRVLKDPPCGGRTSSPDYS